MAQVHDVAFARRVADLLRAQGNAAAAEALERAIAEVDAGKRDLASIDIGVSYRLEKFDGEITPGKVPVEVISGREASASSRL